MIAAATLCAACSRPPGRFLAPCHACGVGDAVRLATGSPTTRKSRPGMSSIHAAPVHSSVRGKSRRSSCGPGVLAHQKTTSTSVAAAAIGQLVEQWYFPNYAKVQQICRDAMQNVLETPPGLLKGDLAEVRTFVVDNLAKRCAGFAKAAEADGDTNESRHWKQLAKNIRAWKKAGRNDGAIVQSAASSARTAYNNMMAANLRGRADLDPEDVRTARELERLAEHDSPAMSPIPVRPVSGLRQPRPADFGRATRP